MKGGRAALKTVRIDSAPKLAAVGAAAVFVVIAAIWSAKWGLANTAALRADLKEVAVYTAELAPDDPQTHFTAAKLLEKSFDPGDFEKAISEYERSVALAPNNYNLWLELGHVRERNGDPEGAERAMRRALELAPNYSRVQWALGNSLVRQGRTDEGFSLIRAAVAGDSTFTDPAAVTAWQILDGDLGRVRTLLGDSPRLNASLALILAKQKRYDEALEVWNAIPAAEKSADLKETGKSLLGQFSQAKRYREMARLTADLAGDGDAKIGQITNGGFEDGLRATNAGTFDWQIADGPQPQIAPTSGQKHSGSNSLVLIFNSQDAKDFRSVSQTLAVEPGKAYNFEIFYRSDLKASASFKWEIADAATGKALARTDAVVNRSEWSPLSVKFTVPSATDGIIVRLVRENCSVVCPVNGNIWFDDAQLSGPA